MALFCFHDEPAQLLARSLTKYSMAGRRKGERGILLTMPDINKHFSTHGNNLVSFIITYFSLNLEADCEALPLPLMH